MKDPQNQIQEWLDKSAYLSNNGLQDTEEYRNLIFSILLHRDDRHRPPCFGQDDCSTLMLSRCPWRIDCG